MLQPLQQNYFFGSNLYVVDKEIINFVNCFNRFLMHQNKLLKNLKNNISNKS